MNILYDPLPDEWNGYKVNTWFQIGIQVQLVFEDSELMDFEKTDLLLSLMFGEEDGTLRAFPRGDDLNECVKWFLNGWNHDKPSKKKQAQKKVMDFYVDQWRIYADFRQIYGINLNEADLHWWEFCGLLWNMPSEQSSFFRVLEIRQKEIKAKMPKEQKEAYRDAKAVYALDQPQKEYTEEEVSKIDDFDAMMAERKKRRQ